VNFILILLHIQTLMSSFFEIGSTSGAQIMLHHLHQRPPIKDLAPGRGNHLAHPFRRGSDWAGGKDTDLNTVLGLSFPHTHPVHPAEEALFFYPARHFECGAWIPGERRIGENRLQFAFCT